MYERAILRIGAVSFALGLITVVVFEALHPAHEDPNNNPLVFAEYAAFQVLVDVLGGLIHEYRRAA